MVTLRATPGGLFVAVAVFGMILYQFRTVLAIGGIDLPIVPYMIFVALVMVAAYGAFAVSGRLETPSEAHPVDE